LSSYFFVSKSLLVEFFGGITMRVSEKRSKSPLAIGVCITAVVTVAGTAYALTHPRQDTSASVSLTSNVWQPLKGHSCKTIVFDPQPPLNVRSAPLEQKGNIIGGIANGTELTILLEKDGWYQISAPTSGWVYKNLTKTNCGMSNRAATTSPPTQESDSSRSVDQGKRLLEKATDHYQAGNLEGAIALAKSVSIESAAYDQAQVALRTMPQKWNQAKSKYAIAKQALVESRWSDVLKVAVEYPDIRHWRQKLAPIVKKATLLQYHLKASESSL
jgi:hypothetical protein